MPASSGPPLLVAVGFVEVRVLVRGAVAFGDLHKILIAPIDVLTLLGTPPVKIVDPVRAGHLAIAAADTAVKIGGHQTVCPLVACPDRADLYAGSIVAVHAGPRHERDAGVGIPSLLKAEDVHEEVALRGVVLHLAGLHAGPASRAPIDINHHSVSRHRPHLLYALKTRTFTWKDWSALLLTYPSPV